MHRLLAEAEQIWSQISEFINGLTVIPSNGYYKYKWGTLDSEQNRLQSYVIQNFIMWSSNARSILDVIDKESALRFSEIIEKQDLFSPGILPRLQLSHFPSRGSKGEFLQKLAIDFSMLKGLLEGKLSVLSEKVEKQPATPQSQGNLQEFTQKESGLKADPKEEFLFGWNEIHPEIVKVTQKLFGGGHYAEAVEASFKEINDQVKNIVKQETGEERDGADLMHFAFRDKSPTIKLTKLLTESDKNIQEGYHLIFAGSMMGIRNPCAHKNLIMNKVDAFHKILIASDLMSVLSNRISPPIKDAKCSLCGLTFSQQGLKIHLRTCQKKHASIARP